MDRLIHSYKFLFHEGVRLLWHPLSIILYNQQSACSYRLVFPTRCRCQIRIKLCFTLGDRPSIPLVANPIINSTSGILCSAPCMLGNLFTEFCFFLRTPTHFIKKVYTFVHKLTTTFVTHIVTCSCLI